MQHLIQECEAADVRMGMRVEAGVAADATSGGRRSPTSTHFRPTGEPDAPFDSYAGHL